MREHGIAVEDGKPKDGEAAMLEGSSVEFHIT